MKLELKVMKVRWWSLEVVEMVILVVVEKIKEVGGGGEGMKLEESRGSLGK